MVRHRRVGVISGILCLAVLTVTACSAGSSSAVTVATAVNGTIATEVGGQGSAAASVDVPIALGFYDHVDGVSVGLGQQVRKGQPLLALDPQPLLANAAKL